MSGAACLVSPVGSVVRACRMARVRRCRWLRPVIRGGLGILGTVIATLTGAFIVPLQQAFFPPQARPTFIILRNEHEQRGLRLEVINNGDRETAVTGLQICSAADASHMYDRRSWLRGRGLEAMPLATPVDLPTYMDLAYRTDQQGWVVECSPVKTKRPPLQSGERRVPPGGSTELVFAPVDGITIETSEGQTGTLVGGNTWCAVTLIFRDRNIVSRIYLCRTADGARGIVPDVFSTPGRPPPELRAIPES